MSKTSQLKAAKGRRKVVTTTIHTFGRNFDVLIYLEAHAALAAPGDLEGDPARWKAQERAVAEAAAEIAAQHWPSYLPEVLDAECSTVEQGPAQAVLVQGR